MLRLCRQRLVVGRSAIRHNSTRQSSFDLYLSPPLSEDEHKLNAELWRLASTYQFSAAERLRLKIISNALHITPRVEYANVALSCLKNQLLTGSSGNKLLDYKSWLALVPDRQTLRHSQHNRSLPPPQNIKSPFSNILRELTYRKIPLYLMPYLTETGLAIASRGYLEPHIFTIIRPILAAALTFKSPAVQEVFKMERQAIAYEVERGLPSKPLAIHLRSTIVMSLIRRNWTSLAVRVARQERDFPLNDAAFSLLLSKMKYGMPEHRHITKIKLKQKIVV